MTKCVLVRGGSWDPYPGDCRSAYRSWNHPVSRYGCIGFRVVCSANKKPIEHVPLRGGAWISYPCDCRSAYRDWDHPVLRDSAIGFRVCCPAAKPGDVK